LTTIADLDAVSKAIGTPTVSVAREKHGKDVLSSELFNASISWDMEGIRAWDDHHGLPVLSTEAVTAFSRYLEDGNFVFFHSLVEHPAVPDAFRQEITCSVVVQRGDIYYAKGREDLFLQTQFHNASSDEAQFVNLAPTAVVHMSFSTDNLWYPLELTRLQQEPTSVVLNLMTDGPIEPSELPEGLRVEKRAQLRQGLQRFSITQVTAILEGGAEIADLRVRL